MWVDLVQTVEGQKSKNQGFSEKKEFHLKA